VEEAGEDCKGGVVEVAAKEESRVCSNSIGDISEE